MLAVITGGAGFIGSHIATALVARGDTVRVYDNLSSGKRSNLADIADEVEFVHADIRDASQLTEAFRGCEVVFHQAAIVSVPYSIERPEETQDTNLRGTLNVLQAARASGVRRVVFASSAAIYGDDPELPKRETMPPNPISPYGIEKLTGEHYLRVYAKLHGIETVALRYFNVFGPRQDPSSAYSGVISIFVNRALAGTRPTIYGDGSASRDFVYVDNVVDANVRAAFSSGATGRALNVACGVATTLRDLIAALSRIVGREIDPVCAEPRPGDITDSLADISLARSVLGYEPRVDVETGLRRLVAYVQQSLAKP